MSIRDNLGGGGAVLDSLEEIKANTTPGKAAGALAVNELSNSLVPVDITSQFAPLDNTISFNGTRLMYLLATKNVSGFIRVQNSGNFTANTWTTVGYIPDEYKGIGGGTVPCVFNDGSGGFLQFLSSGEIKVYTVKANITTAHAAINYYC